ncbi:TPA: hypothetical protein ACVFH3_005405 [Pseudomonas aeruginosa]|uniref:hypothetical protein n=1 Tax=Pseudomonas aeruginosa TaxID=287 RepID=UPI002902F40D|nr:hypothetical protein [Pseudomonas aeruginosa]MDU0704041.1 hypothetical protein [Pseudomonas aeruginosa]
MAAIVAAELIHKPEFSDSGVSVSLLPALAATLAGVLSRSLFVTVIVDVVAFLFVRSLLV